MQIDPAVTDEFLEILATVAAVPVTPFGPDGAPDWDCHARLIGRLIENGITLITPNGNTGEFYTLTSEETRAATESAIRAVRGRAEVLVGVYDIAHTAAACMDLQHGRPVECGQWQHRIAVRPAPLHRPIPLHRPPAL